MSTVLQQAAKAIRQTSLHQHAVEWLQTIPGLPPIVQTVHIVSIALVFASVVMLSLRTLGIAVPSQSPQEMSRRLMPWFWVSLVLLFLSGALFVLARPNRYFSNPIFGIKMAMLVPAIALSAVLAARLRRAASVSGIDKFFAVGALSLWVCVVLAGRWIAYLDYLLPVE